MTLVRNDKTKEWEATFSSESEAKEVSEILKAAAHEGVGNTKGGRKFAVRLNDIKIEVSTNLELWMLAYGMELGYSRPKPKEKVRVSEKSKDTKSKDETPYDQWDEAFEESKQKDPKVKSDESGKAT